MAAEAPVRPVRASSESQPEQDGGLNLALAEDMGRPGPQMFTALTSCACAGTLRAGTRRLQSLHASLLAPLRHCGVSALAESCSPARPEAYSPSTSHGPRARVRRPSRGSRRGLQRYLRASGGCNLVCESFTSHATVWIGGIANLTTQAQLEPPCDSGLHTPYAAEPPAAGAHGPLTDQALRCCDGRFRSRWDSPSSSATQWSGAS